MEIIEAINVDTNLSECELSIGNEQMTKEDREANVVVHFDWHWNDDETERIVSEIYPIEMDEVYFYEKVGNYFATFNHAKALVTIEYIQTLINK